MPFLPIKNQIAREKYKGNILREVAEFFSGFEVNCPCPPGISFALWTLADGRAVNDQLRPVLSEQAFDSLEVSQIKVTARQRAGSPSRRVSRRRLRQIMTDESTRASDPRERPGFG